MEEKKCEIKKKNKKRGKREMNRNRLEYKYEEIDLDKIYWGIFKLNVREL